MHFSTLVLLVAVLHCTAFTLAVPTNPKRNPPILTARSQFCYNAPHTKAGTRLGHRALPPPNLPLSPRTDGPEITWCAPDSATYVMIVNEYPFALMPETDANNLLLSAYSGVLHQIQTHGDGQLPQGHYTLQEYGLELTFMDANNHQQTWGVVGAALTAIGDYFAQYLHSFGAITFAVFDGPHMVGTGALQLP